MTFTFSISAVGICIAWMMLTAVLTFGRAIMVATYNTPEGGLAAYLYTIAGILLAAISATAAGWLP